MRNFWKSWFDGPSFQRDSDCLSEKDVFVWWERRRLFFNWTVGGAGVITCILLLICAFVSESLVGEAIGLPDGPVLGIFGIVFYGILANVFYTGGWICELVLRSVVQAEKAAAIGVRTFRVGVTFSVLLTLSPIALCWISFFIALAHGQKHGQPGE